MTLADPQDTSVVEPTDGPAISVEAVSHFYRKLGQEVEVLHEVSFVAAPGEFVSIIGPSGCGKSTLLYLIAGFLTVSAGRVVVFGGTVRGPSRDRGVVFQADAVFPWLTVDKNVDFGLRLRHVSKEQRQAIVSRYLQLVGLEGSGPLYPRQLSEGMRKRVDVARVFANGPRMLLMDESFGSLDAQTKETLQLALLSLWEKEKQTAIFITHDIEEAVFLADRVLVMSRSPGRIIEDLTVPFARPRDVALKLTPEFQSIRRDLSSLLHDR